MATLHNVLVLATFETEAAADEAAEELKAWEKANKQVQLNGIGVLVKDQFGEIQQHKIGPTQGRKGIGVGMLLGVVAALPTGGLSLLPGLAGGAFAGGVVGAGIHKGFHDLSQADAERISRELDAGHAIVGVLTPPDQADAVLEQLAQHGGKIESHELSDDELEEAAHAVAAADQPGQPSQESEPEAQPPA